VFVEVIKSKGKNGKIYETHLVRESFRTPNGPRSRTVCNISKLPASIRDMITQALKGSSLVDIDAVSLPEACDFGGLAVLRDAWSRFGLDALFSNMPSQHAARLKAMIFARLLFPSSKLALADKARGTVLALACGLGREWSMAGELQEVTRLLLSLQTIRVEYLKIGTERQCTVMTDIPIDLAESIKKLKIHKLFATPPSWVTWQM
jgi:hypothetical protein